MRRPGSVLRSDPACAPSQPYMKRVRLQFLSLRWSNLEKLAASIAVTDNNLLVTSEPEPLENPTQGCQQAASPIVIHIPASPCSSGKEFGQHPATQEMAHSDTFDATWQEIITFFRLMTKCHSVVFTPLGWFFTLLHQLFANESFEVQSEAKNWLYFQC